MIEHQEGNHPVAEIQEEGAAVSAAEAVPTLSTEELDALLSQSANVATVAAMSEQEIDALVARLQESLERLQDVDTIRESRLQKVENFNPLGDLKPSDYERLVQEGMIDEEKDQVTEQGKVIMLSAKRFRTLDEQIAQLQSLKYPSADASAFLERLLAVRGDYQERLASQIQERQEEIAARREEVRNKVLEHYAKRTEELERAIAEIKSNPRVMERLQTMAEKEMKEFFAQQAKAKQEAAARLESELKAVIQEATRYIQSLGARHANAFKRLGEILGNKNIADELTAALREEDARKQQSAFDRVRSRLITAIIEGEGDKQLKNPKEIVPWKVTSTSISYGPAINDLRFFQTEQALRAAAEAGNEQAKKLLEQREQILNENEAIRRLVGPQWITDRRTGERRMGAFWAAFETRKKNDKDGITAARKKEREEAAKREAAFKEAVDAIIARGGFVVEVPVVKNIRGQQAVIGKERGAVRLEKGRSPERVVKDPKTGRETKKGGNEYWKVVEIFGAAGGLKVGQTSPLNMGAFPQWFREAAKPYFVMSGEDFIERMTKEK